MRSVDLLKFYLYIPITNQILLNGNSIWKRFANDWRRNQVGTVGLDSVYKPNIGSQKNFEKINFTADFQKIYRLYNWSILQK